jgi:hypothetical protein
MAFGPQRWRPAIEKIPFLTKGRTEPGMIERDHFTIALKCPRCGRSGEAQVSEDAHDHMHDPGFKVDKLPEGFGLAKDSPYRWENVYSCKCGVTFNA